MILSLGLWNRIKGPGEDPSEHEERLVFLTLVLPDQRPDPRSDHRSEPCPGQYLGPGGDVN